MADIFVVEGLHDKSKLEEVLDSPLCVITNGSEISKETITELQELAKNNRIILLLDPDGPGERIRRIIQDNVPNTVNIFVKKEVSISKNKKKVGVEHVDPKILKEALKDYKDSVNYTDLTMQDLFELGLNGTKESKRNRELICEAFNIGYATAKTLLYKFKLFGITKEDLLKKIEEISHE